MSDERRPTSFDLLKKSASPSAKAQGGARKKVKAARGGQILKKKEKNWSEFLELRFQKESQHITFIGQPTICYRCKILCLKHIVEKDAIGDFRIPFVTDTVAAIFRRSSRQLQRFIVQWGGRQRQFLVIYAERQQQCVEPRFELQ